MKTVKEYLGNRHKLYRAGITFLLRGDDMDNLKRKRLDLTTVLLGAGLQPVRPEFEVGPLNTAAGAANVFNPDSDKKYWYTRLTGYNTLRGCCRLPGGKPVPATRVSAF